MSITNLHAAFAGQNLDADGHRFTTDAMTGGLIANTSRIGIFAGTGAPTFTAPANSLYLRIDGSSTITRMYVNTTGSTTWTTVTTGA